LGDKTRFLGPDHPETMTTREFIDLLLARL
jgi:hypothetical protein